MKKKKLPLIGAIILVALYLFFGLGSDIPPAADPVMPSETLSATIQETLDDVTEAIPPETQAITQATLPPTCAEETAPAEPLLDPNGSYTTKEDVALYIHLYGQLPGNFMTKDEARDLGWEGGGLEDFAPGMCIGGDRFGNYEGLLPDASGRRWTECDIDTLGRNSRGAKRIVFSNDGLIYYTDDHYESFELLYGEE